MILEVVISTPPRIHRLTGFDIETQGLTPSNTMCRVCGRWLAKQDIQWAEIVLKRSDEYRRSQAAFATDRFSRSSVDFGMEIGWHDHCGWLPLYSSRGIAILSLPNLYLARQHLFEGATPCRLIPRLIE